MTILDRNAGVFESVTSFNITRSTGSYGTGTVIAVMIWTNNVYATPSGWTQRQANVASMGLYAFDRTGAGEASFTFSSGSPGSGRWYAWELSSGSNYLTGSVEQVDSGSTTHTATGVTPTAGNRHLLWAVGGVNSNPLAVNSVSDSFAITLASAQASTQDKPASAGAERDVTADGLTLYQSTATFSAATAVTRGGIMLAYNNNAGDVTPPSVPTGLATTALGSTTAGLSWNAASDNVGVTGYEVQIIGP